MLIPSIDLMDGKIVQLIQGKKKALEFDNIQEWLARFSKYPLVQLIDLDAAMGRGVNSDLVHEIATAFTLSGGRRYPFAGCSPKHAGCGCTACDYRFRIVCRWQPEPGIRQNSRHAAWQPADSCSRWTRLADL